MDSMDKEIKDIHLASVLQHNEKLKKEEWGMLRKFFSGEGDPNIKDPSVESIRKGSKRSREMLETKFMPNINFLEKKCVQELSESLGKGSALEISRAVAGFMKDKMNIKYNLFNAWAQGDIKKGVNLNNSCYALDDLDKKVLLDFLSGLITELQGLVSNNPIRTEKQKQLLEATINMVQTVKDTNTANIKNLFITNNGVSEYKKLLDEVIPMWATILAEKRADITKQGVLVEDIYKQSLEGKCFSGVCRDFSVIFYELFNEISRRNNLGLHAILVVIDEHEFNRILDKEGKSILQIDISEFLQEDRGAEPDKTSQATEEEFWISSTKQVGQSDSLA